MDVRQVTQAQRHAAADRLQNSPVGQLDPATPLLVLRGYCPTCGAAVTTFRDDLSSAEFLISGMCQACQDSVFGVDLEGPMETPIDPSLFEAENGAER